MDPEQAPGAGRDGDRPPRVPAPGGGPDTMVTPDWLDDADWERACASRAGAEAPPDDEDAQWYADPDHGPPPELADVPFEVLAARIEADGAAEAAATARAIGLGICPEGYAHRPGAPPVPGASASRAAPFAQGGPFDALPPDTTLAGLADEASGADRAFAGVTDDELMGLIGARRRLESRAAWELLAAVAEFIRRRPAGGCPLAGPERMPAEWGEHADGELGAQLRLSRVAADELIGLAHALAVKLPATAAALRDGVIDLARARLIAWRCDPLTREEARAAEALLFADPHAGEWTLGVIRDRIARAVITVNPEAAVKRREQAARTRRVEMRPEGPGNAMLAGRELPPAAVLAASQNLTVRARQLRAAGLAGGMDELRVLAYLEKLGALDPLDGAAAPAGTDAPAAPAAAADGTGQDPADGTGQNPDARVPGDTTGTADAATGGGPGGPDDPGGPGSGGDPDRQRPAGPGGGTVPGAVPAGFAARVNLTVPLVTLLGLAGRPGMLPGLGAIDPALARDLAAAAARHPRSTWCLTVTGPDHRPVAHGCGRPPPRRARDRDGPAPPVPAARDGPARFPGDQHGPPGGYGSVRLDPAALTGAAVSGRELVFALEALAGPCDHRHRAAGHDPGVLLRHLTGILNASCTFPPCRRPAGQCDYEHSLPHERGGLTCLCQAGPVCRASHRAKQSPGWHLQDAGDRGWFRWTTPSGRSYLSRPTQYPD